MSKPMHPADGSECPQWKKARSKVCHTCAWYILVRGNHPQTGASVDTWDCAIALMPMLSIENAMVNRQTTATVDALRKEVKEANDQNMVGALSRLNQQMDETRQIAQAAGLSPQKLIGN